MRDVFLRVAVVLTLLAPGVGLEQAAAKPKPKQKSAFEQLDEMQLMNTLGQFNMEALIKIDVGDGDPAAVLAFAKIAAKSLVKITDPDKCLEEGKSIIKKLEAVIDTAGDDMDTADEAAKKASERTKSKSLEDAARKAQIYYEILYLVGDIAGRQAVEQHALMLKCFQDNRQDRADILKMTENAVDDLEAMREDFKEKMRDWQNDMSVWMILGGPGELLLKKAAYFSSLTYLNRAMALGDSESHQTERDALAGKYNKMLAKTPAEQAGAREKIKTAFKAELAALVAKHKKGTSERRELLEKILVTLPPFERDKSSGVPHDARKTMAIAYRELGQYEKALTLLDANRYAAAPRMLKMVVSKERIFTLVKQGKFEEAQKKITEFQGYAVLLIARGKPTELQQAYVDREVAMLNDYLYRRWGAASSDANEKRKHRIAADTAMLTVYNKYKKEGIRRSFINFFGNRLLDVEDVKKLGSMQLYFCARGAAAAEEHDKRREMLEELLSRTKDPTVAKLAPSAHFLLGGAMNYLKRNIDAAKNFMIASKLYAPTDSEKSATSAHYASICLRSYDLWYKANRKRDIPQTVREKYVEAMTVAVGFVDKKYPKLKLVQWYYPLGDNRDKLSQSAKTPAETVKLMTAAADAFSKVPSDPPADYFNAQDMWLDLRYRAMKQAKKDAATTAATAGKLREDYAQFVVRIEKYIAGLSDKAAPLPMALTEAAAWADFRRAKMLAEQMGKPDQALAEIEAMLKKWSAVESVVVAGNQWQIQSLIDSGKIAEASKALEAFLKKNPEAGASLIGEVVEGIRKAIGEAEIAGGQETQLASLRKSYLFLADRLYASVKDKGIVNANGTINDDRLSRTRFWIDALIQNGRGADAMAIALKNRKVFDKRREAAYKKIEAKYAARISAAKVAKRLFAGVVKGLEAELIRLSKASGGEQFDPVEDYKSVEMAVRAYNSLPKNAAAAQKDRRATNVTLEVRNVYLLIIRRLKARVLVRVNVEWDMAKCLAATGKPAEATNIYKDILQLITPPRNRDQIRMYWSMQLEYCKALVAAVGSNKAEMGKLVTYIDKSLPEQAANWGGATRGGLKSQFFAVKARAAKLSE